jgi:hypothetical protein
MNRLGIISAPATIPVATSRPSAARGAGAVSAAAWVAWPFDAMRWAYAAAVHAGLLKRSILASRDFEHMLGALERLALGPLARRV